MNRSYFSTTSPPRESFSRPSTSQLHASAAPTRQDVLTSFGTETIQENDPSLVDGFQIQYEREVSFMMRTPDSEGEPEAIRVKILTLVESQRLVALRIEALCENDLFFYYVSTITEATFNEMKAKQRLVVGFSDFPSVLFKMFNSVIKNPQSYLAQFIFLEDGTAALEFLQNMEYKVLFRDWICDRKSEIVSQII
eukprot:TRINITY_DN5894_c0_g1_i5.p1 TRINITY_DN5894_c0_g1~~TRINITY_DN5894_c0_g1_i5.p1  ORF type:complete len:195 (-),score=30.32 TRINITY_DN5894_c0_g1_i5:65-649(-)